MRALVAIAIAAIGLPARAQGWQPATHEELLARLDASAARYRAMENYEARSTLLVFARANHAEPSERGESRVWKVGGRAKAEHLGIISYQDERLRVTIDPEEEVIVLAEPEEFVGLGGIEERREMLRMAVAIDKRPHERGEAYRMTLPKGSEYKEVLFFFDGTGWLRRMETLWADPVALIPDNPLSETILPRVVMELDPPRPINPSTIKASPSEAITFRNGNPTPVGRFAAYRVIDNRLRP